jgi:hypothetical protein
MISRRRMSASAALVTHLVLLVHGHDAFWSASLYIFPLPDKVSRAFASCHAWTNDRLPADRLSSLAAAPSLPSSAALSHLMVNCLSGV